MIKRRHKKSQQNEGFAKSFKTRVSSDLSVGVDVLLVTSVLNSEA